MPFGLKRLSVAGKPAVNNSERNDEKEVLRATSESRENRDGTAPPTYTPDAPSLPAYDQPTADELNAGFANLNIGDLPQNFPTPDTTLAHLKLLEAFYALKGEVAYNDGVFDLWDSRTPGTVESVAHDEMARNTRNEALSKLREKRWALYVARAVDRFEAWWMTILCAREGPNRRMLTQEGMLSTSFQDFPRHGAPMVWTPAMLPPLDVLMVWHSFMLNPRNYLEDCLRYGLKNIWATGMPWHAVNLAIDTAFNYEVPEEGKIHFFEKTGHAWDNLDDSPNKSIKCPRCAVQLSIPWTTCGLPETNESSWRPGLVGTGYGEKDLSFFCERCGGEVTQDLLRVGKFKKETENLLLRDWPMGGTVIAGTYGIPETIPLSSAAQYHGTFANRLIRLELKTQILELVAPGRSTRPTMTEIRDLIEQAIQQPSIIKKVNGKSGGGVLKREERLSIRKMMSRYWDNHQAFSMELSGAVIRQGVFVDKMHKIDWLHSPAASTTMQRLLIKYDRFFRIMADNTTKTAVPTLDIDLAWHTHQLSPAPYFDYSVKMTRIRFIDHDDKIQESVLAEAFEWTSKTYEKAYNTVYSECTCWYCEAIRAKHSSPASKLLGGSKHDKITDEFYASGAAKMCPPDASAHISAHNAVPVETDALRGQVAANMLASQQMQLDEAYARACRRAQKKGRPIPKRERYYEDRFGYGYYGMYPYMMPLYINPMMYPYPMYMPMGVGMYGACAAGTCGGTVGSGGCAAGGCGGGCGAAAGGGGGCGGGDGGGGGGCGGGGGGGGGCGGGCGGG